MSRPLKTLHLTTIDLTAYCFLRSWFRTLSQRGAQVTLACTVEKFRDELVASGAEVLHLPIERRVRPLQDLGSFLDLYYLIRRIEPDVVHTHTSKAGFLGRLAARLAGVPLIVHTIHELPENAAQSTVQKGFYWLLEWIAARMAHHLVTVSEPNQKQILREFLCAPKKLTLIREGLDLEAYVPRRSAAEVRQELGIPVGAPLVGCVGRLEPAKGHEDLLEAFRQVLAEEPEARLVVVGEGYQKADLLARVAQLGLESRVLYTGWREDMLDLLGAFDVFALASHYEGLGIAILEAMALRRPTVCTAVGGVLDVVQDGETGYLVPAREPAAMAARIVELLRDPERRAAMGEVGRRRVEEHFRDEDANRKMLGLYQHLLQKHRRLAEFHPLGPKGV